MVDEKGHLMVRVPAGIFSMGLEGTHQGYLLCSITPEASSCEPDVRFANEMPLHEVTLSQDYWMDVYEVTNAQYSACVNVGVCDPPLRRGSNLRSLYYADPAYGNYPHVYVSWQDAQFYCQTWRGGRLPTEAEWEYAARGTDGCLWPWGNTPPIFDWSANYSPYEAMGEALRDTMEVGSFPVGVSPFGLYDMAGNVWEWTLDWYGLYPEHAVTDPTGPTSGTHHTARGGSFADSPVDVSAVIRLFVEPGRWGGSSVGFRCVLPTSP